MSVRPTTSLAGLSAVKLALLAKQARAQSGSILRADPIAIVGMACRVPGAGTPDQYWRLLRDRVDAVREIPGDRWDAGHWYDPDLAAAGKAATRSGGFLQQIDAFDADYFGILPREAERMDPQQRLFLEVAIEALDDAGFSREYLRGEAAGVFIASYHNDYSYLQYDDIDAIDARTLTGTLHSVLANRLSHFLDLRGPSISIDTACSSSLVAVHLACQSLRSGESDVAIAGGVSLMIAPGLLVSMSKVGFMAGDGRCKTFDARADGFGRGEGCGVIVLKRLADAVADGDRLLAVVRGSAVNQDGHSTLLAAPHGPAQEALIREALANAQLEPSRIGFIETHGTGTALGDPIEVEAIAAVVGREGPASATCWLGSAKANLGHLEAAAGVAGLIKAVLVLQHEVIPPQVHFSKLNPHISLEGTRLAIPTALTPWPPGTLPRCAGVSSFGVGGTNAHVILEEAPTLPAVVGGSVANDTRLLTISAHSEAGLRSLAESWTGFLDDTSDDLDDVCFTATERHTHYDWRLGVVGATKEELQARVSGFLKSEFSPSVTVGHRPSIGPRVAFVFSGQGPQWHAMGRELFEQEAVFRDTIIECDKLIQAVAGWSLVEALAQTEDGSRLDQTEIAQPALFSLQVALAAMWRSWGIEPDGVVGHSVGEIAALHVAGVLELNDAVRVVVQRGRIMQKATGLGRMASVAMTEADANELVRPFGERLSVAAINAPRSVVLSGEADALDAALAELTHRGISHRSLPVRYAFHSAQMAPFQQRLAREVAGLPSSPATTAVYSTVTGGLATAVRFDGDYFGRNVRNPVRLAGAVGAMIDDGYDVFVEVGPHPVLVNAITECLSAGDRAATVVTSLRRGKPERDAMLQAVAGVYSAGCSVDWSALQPGPRRVVSLPMYPWQRKRFWLRPRPRAESSPVDVATHPLLGRRLPVAGNSVCVWTGDSATAGAWLADHRIFGRLVLPAAAVLEMFVAAASAALDSPRVALTGFTMTRPLFIPNAEDALVQWQVVATKGPSNQVDLELYEEISSVDGWQSVAIARGGVTEPRELAPASPEMPTTAFSLTAPEIYARFQELGVEFGPTFRCLREVRYTAGAAEGWIETPEGTEPTGGFATMHPGLFDGALQLCSLAAGPGSAGEMPARVLLPIGADRLFGDREPTRRMRVRAQRREAGSSSLCVDVTVETPDGGLISRIEGMRFTEARPSAFADLGDSLYDVAWRPAGPSWAADDAAARPWLILADRGGTGDALQRELARAGARVCRVRAGEAFVRLSGDEFIVNPHEPDDFRRLLSEGGWSAGIPFGNVVHLWGLDIESAGHEADAERDDLLAYGSALHLLQSVSGATPAAGAVWLVSRGGHVVTGDEEARALNPRAAGLWGLATVAAVEYPELRVRFLDLDLHPVANEVADLIRELGAPGSSIGSALRRGQRWVPELARFKSARSAPAAVGAQRLHLARPGTLEGVELVPAAVAALGPDEVRVRVLAAGVNFRDVLVTLGMYPGDVPPLGAECSGVVTEVGSAVTAFARGDRVFGFAPGGMSTELAVPAAFLAPLPGGMRADVAAGLPVAFLTAFYGIHRLARLQPGERILIHAAAGGVGIAAVELALRVGAEVFVTAGSAEKREWLRTRGVKHVMDSRSLAFVDEVAAATRGEGVHVVLNSLAGAFISASLKTLARGGRFLELGKRDILTVDEAASLRPDVHYRAYDLGAEAFRNPAVIRPMLDEILAGLADASLAPLPVTVFPLSEARDAFRHMAQARHIGKIVLRAAHDEQALVTSDATYWLTGGFGALGMETAQWLVSSGARHLVLSGRRPPTPAVQQRISAWERQGVAVHVAQGDVADRRHAEQVLGYVAASMPPLRGVVHAAGVVRDTVLSHQRWNDCREVLRGKTHGAFLLDELTRDLPLDFFVLYSAAGALLGAGGQGMYPAANIELDALARKRHALGLPALSVAWGVWAGEGMAANAQGADAWTGRGLRAISSELGFACLERLLRDRVPYGVVLPIDWTRFLTRLPGGLDRAFFRAVVQPDQAASPVVAPLSGPTFSERLGVMPAAQRRQAVLAHVGACARQVLGLDATTPVPDREPLKNLGLDSLTAMELRNTLVRSMRQALPATLLFDYPTPDQLTGFLIRALGYDGAPTAPPSGSSGTPAITASVTAVAGLSDDEAEAELIAELNRSVLGTPRG